VIVIVPTRSEYRVCGDVAYGTKRDRDEKVFSLKYYFEISHQCCTSDRYYQTIEG